MLAAPWGCAGPAPRARPSAAKTAPSECLIAARAAAHLDPEAPRSFLAAHEAFARGQDLEAQGDFEGARAEYAAAVRADPSHGLARLALAEAHWRTDQDLEAIHRHLAAAVVLLPENPRAHLRFATASAELGQGDIAARHYGCALALKADLTEAHVALARHALTANDPRTAERHARAAATAEPEDYRHQVLLAQALEGLGRLDEAAQAAARAATLVDRSAPLYRRAAELFDRAGQPDRAAPLRARADELDPPPERRDLRPLRKARKRRPRKRR